MLNTWIKLTAATAAIALLPLGGLQAAEKTPTAQKAASLLQQIEATARDIREHAAKIRTATYQPTLHAPEWHFYHLNAMTEESDQMGEFVKKFKSLREDATMRQQRAFNVVVQHAAKLADDIRHGVKIANESQSKVRIFHPDYESTIDSIYQQADSVVAGVGLAESWEEIVEAHEELSGPSE